MPSCRRRGKTIQSEAREVIRRIIEVCDQEFANSRIQFGLHEATRRAANYTGFSERTICRIRRECNKAEDKKLHSSGGQETQPAPTNSEVWDNCDTRLVRNVLMDFYLVHNVIPTSSRLLAAVNRKTSTPWGVYPLRNLLKDMGFTWKKFENKGKILIERPQITLWRLEYFKFIRKAREDNKNIIYVGDTWVDNKLNVKKCWHGGEWTVSQISRLIILHACTENGFVENAQFIFKVGQTTQYSGKLNYGNFKKWLTEKLLPNIQRNSVIVLDGSESYHSTEQNKVPSKYATKTDMIGWLEKNNVPFSPQMCRVELLDLINKYKSDKKIYCIDEMLKLKGHTVLRLPPYMCELNPLHLASKKLENILTEKKKTVTPSNDNYKAVIIEALSLITDTDWKSFYSYVQKREEHYWELEKTMDTELEIIIANMENSDSMGSASDSGSELSQSLSDEEEWPPFELVECGEDVSTVEEQPDSRQHSILESILEGPRTTNHNTSRTPHEKKRPRHDDNEKQTNGDDNGVSSHTKRLSSADATRLKAEMEQLLHKKLRIERQDEGGASSSTSGGVVTAHTSSQPFSEVLIKEEVSLVDTQLAKIDFVDVDEQPFIIKQENLVFPDEYNPLDTTIMD